MMRRIRPKASKSNEVVDGSRVAAWIAASVLLLAGCGSSESEPGAAGKPSAKAAAAAKNLRPDMVSAVSSSKTPGNVELRFNIPDRPAIGQRMEIQLSLIPTVEIERLVARFQVPDGLEL